MLSEVPRILSETCHLDPGRPVLVGVSGGPDSLCLSHLLISQGYRVIVAHFNHRLRAEAEEDARFVAGLAQKWGVPYVQEEADVRSFARAQRLSLEDAARQLRYRFLFASAERFAAQAVAVGHTADDQVETVLLHFLRGSGLKGLGGMEYVGYLHAFSCQIPLIRPLLSTWREEIEAYCAQHHLAPRRDSTNRSTRFLRNRIRLELLPLLETYNPRLRRRLLEMSRLLREEWSILSESVEKLWVQILVERGDGFLALDEQVLRTYPIPVRRHLIRRGVEELLGRPRDLPFRTLERAALWMDAASSRLILSNDLMLRREAGQIYLLSPAARLPFAWPQIPLDQEFLTVPLNGTLRLGAGWELSTQILSSFELAWQSAQQNTNPYQAWMDISALPRPLILRPPRQGERFAPLGMQGHRVKLSDLFINRKIPVTARARWPLLCAGDEILWVVGVRLAERVRLHPQSREILYISLYRVENPVSSV